ncbi:MAG: hypothetical protein J7M25_16880 [Deltaproteobacteria bacterium]|nr:hypothetical protein [Deltaproteobacteria bacterium]
MKRATSLGILMVVVLVGGTTRASGRSVEALATDLAGGDMSKAMAAAHVLGKIQTSQATDVLMETLLLGVPPKLSVALIHALSGRSKAFDILVHACGNREASVRAAALEILGSIQDQKTELRTYGLAMDALSDGASAVRAAGARLLVFLKKRSMGGIRATKAEEKLLRLLLLRKDQLAAKIGLSALGGARTARFLAVHMEELPPRIVTTIYGALLKRPDFGPEPVRFWVVKVLSGMTGPEAIAAVMEYVAGHQGGKSASVLLARKVAER